MRALLIVILVTLVSLISAAPDFQNLELLNDCSVVADQQYTFTGDEDGLDNIAFQVDEENASLIHYSGLNTFLKKGALETGTETGTNRGSIEFTVGSGTGTITVNLGDYKKKFTQNSVLYDAVLKDGSGEKKGTLAIYDKNYSTEHFGRNHAYQYCVTHAAMPKLSDVLIKLFRRTIILPENEDEITERTGYYPELFKRGQNLMKGVEGSLWGFVKYNSEQPAIGGTYEFVPVEFNQVVKVQKDTQEENQQAMLDAMAALYVLNVLQAPVIFGLSSRPELVYNRVVGEQETTPVIQEETMSSFVSVNKKRMLIFFNGLYQNGRSYYEYDTSMSHFFDTVMPKNEMSAILQANHIPMKDTPPIRQALTEIYAMEDDLAMGIFFALMNWMHVKALQESFWAALMIYQKFYPDFDKGIFNFKYAKDMPEFKTKGQEMLKKQKEAKEELQARIKDKHGRILNHLAFMPEATLLAGQKRGKDPVYGDALQKYKDLDANRPDIKQKENLNNWKEMAKGQRKKKIEELKKQFPGQQKEEPKVTEEDIRKLIQENQKKRPHNDMMNFINNNFPDMLPEDVKRDLTLAHQQFEQASQQ